MKKKTNYLLLLIFIMIFGSCATHVQRLSIYNGPVGNHPSKTDTYSRSKQLYMFWGLLPLGWSQASTPTDKGFQVKTYKGFWDNVIGVISVGIVSSRSTKVIVYEDKHEPSKP